MTLIKRENTQTSHFIFIRTRDPEVLEDVADVIEEMDGRIQDALDANLSLSQELQATDATLRSAVDALVDMGEQLKDAEATIDQLDQELGIALGALDEIHASLSYALVSQPTGISRVYTRSAVDTAARVLGLDQASADAHAGNC